MGNEFESCLSVAGETLFPLSIVNQSLTVYCKLSYHQKKVKTGRGVANAKSKPVMLTEPPSDQSVYRNEAFEKAVHAGKVERYKVHTHTFPHFFSSHIGPRFPTFTRRS